MDEDASLRIKIRHSGPHDKPWKWQIFVGKRLVTASHESFVSQDEAHAAARSALDRIVLDYAARPR